jgi:cobalt-zinc-cadmium efflux system outer membrane protein
VRPGRLLSKATLAAALALLAGCEEPEPRPRREPVEPSGPAERAGPPRPPPGKTDLNYLRAYALAGTEGLAGEQGALNSIAQARQAGLFPNPVFSYQMQNLPVGSGPGGSAEARSLAGITVAIPLGGRVGAARAEAEAIAEEWSASLTVARLDFLRKIDEAYARYLASRERARLAKEVVEQLREGYKELEANVAAGKATKLELLTLQAVLDESVLLADGLEHDRAGAESALEALARIDLRTRGLAGELPTSAPPIDEDRLLERATKEGPRIRLLEKAQVRADASIGRNRAEAFPDLTATLLGGYEGTRNTPILTFGVAVPLPLFNRNQYGVQWALEERDRIDRELAGERLVAQAAAGDLGRSYERARTRIARYREHVIPDAQAALAEAEKELAAGRASHRDVLLARAHLDNVRRIELDERERLALAIAAIERLTGAPVPVKK